MSAPPARPAAPADRKLDINQYLVLGNTVLSQDDIADAVYPYLGPQRPESDVDKARGALERAYAAKGFQAVSVIVPRQTVRGGVVQLQALEARVAEVKVDGGGKRAQETVRKALPAVKPGEVPDLRALNVEVAEFNARGADRQVTPQLKAGADENTVDVDLHVDDKLPLHGSVEANNNYSRSTHELRVQGTLSYDNLWNADHSISATYNVAPVDRKDAEVYALTYSAPVPGVPMRLAVTALKSNSDVNTLGSTNVVGKGQSVTLTASLALPSLGPWSQTLQGSVAYKDFTDRVTQGATINAAPITYYPISIAYAGGLKTAKTVVNLGAQLDFAFRGVGADSAAYAAKRAYAEPDFVYVKAQGSVQHDLPFAQIYAGFDGQVSSGALISNEQYSLGGEGSVRGYLASEALGDEGVRGTFELRTPDLADLKVFKPVTALRFLAFTDGGYAKLFDPLPGQQNDFTLWSTGIGMRSLLMKRLHIDVDLARALVGNGATRTNESRFEFRAYSDF